MKNGHFGALELFPQVWGKSFGMWQTAMEIPRISWIAADFLKCWGHIGVQLLQLWEKNRHVPDEYDCAIGRVYPIFRHIPKISY